MDIVRNKLSGGLLLEWDVTFKERHEGESVVFLHEEEIETVSFLGNLDSFVMNSLLKDKLFEVEESLLMVGSLSDLDTGLPGMWGEIHLAVVTLHVMDNKLDFESLFQRNVVSNVFLDGQLDPESL